MDKDFQGWGQLKAELHHRRFTGYVHEREVWWCSLGANIGYEQDGKHELFERPVLIIRKFNNHAVIVVPLSTNTASRPQRVIFPHGDRDYAALISQIRLISTNRLRRKLYVMNSLIFDAIRKQIFEIL